jgi:hypothetical protein
MEIINVILRNDLTIAILSTLLSTIDSSSPICFEPITFSRGVQRSIH